MAHFTVQGWTYRCLPIKVVGGWGSREKYHRRKDRERSFSLLGNILVPGHSPDGEGEPRGVGNLEQDEAPDGPHKSPRTGLTVDRTPK